jgi:hypothetical protein
MRERDTPLRDLVEEPDFTDALATKFGSVRQGDTQTDALTWKLSREPSFDDYPIVANTKVGDLYAVKTLQFDAFPSLVVYFTVDARGNVVLQGLR